MIAALGGLAVFRAAVLLCVALLIEAIRGIPLAGFPTRGNPSVENHFAVVSLPDFALMPIGCAIAAVKLGCGKVGDGVMRVLGLDCGIASVGWAVLDVSNDDQDDNPTYEIVECGAYCFEQPTVGGTGRDRFTSIKAARSRRIGQMHYLRRKRQKLRDIRLRLVEHGLLADSKKDALAKAMMEVSPKGQKPQITPYDLRAKALDHLLSDEELAVVIGHLATHPGPRPSMKARKKNEEDERGKIKSAVAANAKFAAKGYRTAGEMLARDPEFRDQKHNRSGEWKFTVGRFSLQDELRSIFKAQKRFQNEKATVTLLNSVLDIIERKKEPTDDYFKVGPCRFELGERRASSRSYSFERFRYAENLVKLGISRESASKPTPSEIEAAMKFFGTKSRTTYADLRKLWALPKDALFDGVKKKDEASRDFATGAGDSCHGTFAMREALGSDWEFFESRPKLLDEIARILTFATRADVVRKDIGALALEQQATEKILGALEDGSFDNFAKAAGFSALAARRLLPHLERGLVFSDACKEEKYDHTAPPVNPAENRNPVVRHAVREYLETIKLTIEKHGMPDEIRLEMGRDVALGAEKRLEETERIDKNRRANKKLREECEELIKAKPSSFQVLKYRLAKEQGFKCIYSGKDLCESMRAGFDGLDVDHVLPRSKFHIVGDRANLVVCLSGANANKQDDTPFEWTQRDPKLEWNTLTARVNMCKELPKRKKRFLLMKSTDEIKEAFRKRNLVDMQYAVRLLNAELETCLKKLLLPGEKMPPVVGRPGRLVSWLRQGWGLDRFKYEYEKKRSADDRHHALDAVVVAAISKRTLDFATWQAQQNEKSGRPRDRIKITAPWNTLEIDVERALEKIPIVARQRKTAFAGLLHKETIYALSNVNGQLKKRERKAVDKKLTLDDLRRFQDKSDKGHIKAILEQWIKSDYQDPLPTWKYGLNEDGTERRMPIRKITLLRNEVPEVVPKRLRSPQSVFGQPHATYERAKQMIRVDVFKSGIGDSRAPYLYVPVYPHQMNDNSPPSRYYAGSVEMKDWPSLSAQDQFLFSLVLLDLVEIESGQGGRIRLYFRGLDVDSGRIEGAPLYSLHKNFRQRFSPTKVRSLRKLSVDRMGRVSESSGELRTWRGKVCM